MNSPSPLRVWIGGAIAAFVSGFIEGLPVGGTGGAGIAVADGKFATDLQVAHVGITVAHIVAIPVGTGLADVRAFLKDHPFPNPFTASGSTTTPPFLTSEKTP